MVASNTDRIEKQISLKAPQARVWRALTDHAEFSAWFGVALEQPFHVGATTSGKITHPGYEHLTLEAEVVRMHPEHDFAFRWHPFAIDPDVDYSSEPKTLVEFTLEPDGEGTLLTVTETGFDALPEHRRGEAFLRNSEGWTGQLANARRHLDG